MMAMKVGACSESSRRSTLVSALLDQTSLAEGRGEYSKAVMMGLAASLIGDDPSLSMVAEAYREPLRRLLFHIPDPFPVDARECGCLAGHEDKITAVEFSPDGSRVATASLDGTVRIWNGECGDELVRFQGYHPVTFNAEGTLIVTSTADNTACIRNVASGYEIACLKGHEDDLKTALFSPDGRRVATTASDGTTRIWNAASGEELLCLRGHDAVAFNSQGTHFVTASVEKTACIWDAASTEQTACLKGHAGHVISAKFSPDGTRIVTTSEDSTARIWDVVSGAQITCLMGHKEAVAAAEFISDGQKIVTASYDGSVRIWDVEDENTTTACWENGVRLELALICGPGRGWSGCPAIYLSRDSNSILVSRWVDDSDSHHVCVFDLPGGQEIARPFQLRTEEIAIAFSPDGARVATVADETTVRIWDVGRAAKYDMVHAFTVGQHAVRTLDTFGSALATANGAEVTLWSLLSGERLRVFEGHSSLIRSLAFSPDGAGLASASKDGSWRLWDNDGALSRLVADAHGGAGLWTIAYSPDGTRILTSGADGTARIWHFASGVQHAVLRGHNGAVFFAGFGSNGERVVTFSEDETAALWDSADGRRLKVIKDVVTAIAVSPDGCLFATGHADGSTRFWNVVNGAPEGTPCVAQNGAIRTISFSPDNLSVVTSCDDGALRLVDLAGGCRLLTCEGSGIETVRVSPDGRRILCSSCSGVATVRDVASGRLLARLDGHRCALVDACFVMDGMRIVTASVDGVVNLWEGGSVGGDWGSRLSHNQRRAIVRLGLSVARIPLDVPGERIEGVDDEAAFETSGCDHFDRQIADEIEEVIHLGPAIGDLFASFPRRVLPPNGHCDPTESEAVIRWANALQKTCIKDWTAQTGSCFRLVMPLRWTRMTADTIDRTRPMFSGPLCTSTDHPWPHRPDGLGLLTPILQVYLEDISRIAGENLGDGLLQLWTGENFESSIRIIPSNEVTPSRLTDLPSEIPDPEETFSSIKSAIERDLGLYGPKSTLDDNICYHLLGFSSPLLVWTCPTKDTLTEVFESTGNKLSKVLAAHLLSFLPEVRLRGEISTTSYSYGVFKGRLHFGGEDLFQGLALESSAVEICYLDDDSIALSLPSPLFPQ